MISRGVWYDISHAPRDIAEYRGPLSFGVWLLLTDGAVQRRGRWRHPVEAYDIQTDETVKRPGDWRGEDDRPLGFDPVRFQLA